MGCVYEGTTRMETFSDGVFAIAATLLVLEFSVGSGRDVGSELLHIWPAYLAYVTSFATIGIIWMNHHHTVSLMGRVDRTMLFVNNLLLLVVAFLPFPTKLVADHLRHGGEALRAVDRAYAPGVVMYGAVLVLAFFSPLAAVALTFAVAAFYLPSAALFDR